MPSNFELKDYHPKTTALSKAFFKNNLDLRTLPIREQNISLGEKMAKKFRERREMNEFAAALKSDTTAARRILNEDRIRLVALSGEKLS